MDVPLTPGSTITGASVDERDLVKLVDHGPIISTEGNMTTIAGKRRLAVEWTNDVEQIDGRAVHQVLFIARD
jgi:hypothetical protein